MVFILFISLILLLRIGELLLARSNGRWLLQHGAIEYGQQHYPFIVTLHTLFFISLIIEYVWRGTSFYNIYLFALFALLIGCKAWVIASLGRFWNTRIYRAPNFPLVKKGPYKYVKHPNYIIVVLEIALIPLTVGLYYTAIIFTILNAIMLTIRIKEENKALSLTLVD